MSLLSFDLLNEVAAHCGNPHAKYQLDPFRRLATMHTDRHKTRRISRTVLTFVFWSMCTT